MKKNNRGDNIIQTPNRYKQTNQTHPLHEKVLQIVLSFCSKKKKKKKLFGYSMSVLLPEAVQIHTCKK